MSASAPLDAIIEAGDDGGGNRLSSRMTGRTTTLLKVAFAVVLFGGWEYLCRILNVSELLVPAPSQIAIALVEGFRSGQLLDGLLVTLQEIVLGFVLAAAMGLAVGILISQSKLVESIIYPYIVAFQTLPKVALAPLILIWVGLGLEGKVFVAATVSFFPILVNTIAGLRCAPRNEIDLMLSLSANRWQIFRYVQFPEALPFIFAGLNIGLVLAVLGAIVGEFVGAKAGLGYLILQMNFNMDVSGMFAVLVLLGLMGIFLNAVAQFAQRRLVFWQKESGLGPV